MNINNVRMTICVSLLTVVLFGCNTETNNKPAAKDDPSKTNSDDGQPKEEEHVHGPGPHGGTIADWGGGTYHVEFAVDHEKKEATVYILGDDQKTPVPISTEKLLLTINDPNFQTDLLPSPLDGETAEKCSCFVGTHESLSIVKEYSGIISAEVDGTPYAGNFDEESHDHED